MLSLVSYETFESVKTHPEKIKKMDRKLISGLDYGDIKFLVPKKTMVELKRRIASVLFCLVIKMFWFIRFIYQMKNQKTAWVYC